jgi:hypothetical protein
VPCYKYNAHKARLRIVTSWAFLLLMNSNLSDDSENVQPNCDGPNEEEPSSWAGPDDHYYWNPYLVSSPDPERLTIRRPSDILK